MDWYQVTFEDGSKYSLPASDAETASFLARLSAWLFGDGQWPDVLAVKKGI